MVNEALRHKYFVYYIHVLWTCGIAPVYSRVCVPL